MKLIDLFRLIQQTLSSAGFKPVGIFRNSVAASYWVLEDELRKEKLPGWDIEVIAGMCLEVRVVPHGNGADGDTSYYLEIETWDRSSSRVLERLKVYKNNSERYIVGKIAEFVALYQKAQTELKVDRLIKENSK